MTFSFKGAKWYLLRSENVTALSTTMPRFQHAYALSGLTNYHQGQRSMGGREDFILQPYIYSFKPQ